MNVVTKSTNTRNKSVLLVKGNLTHDDRKLVIRTFKWVNSLNIYLNNMNEETLKHGQKQELISQSILQKLLALY